MADTKSTGGKKGRKIGRQSKHPAHVNYTKGNVLAKNKARRVFKSNGLAAFNAYCRTHDLVLVSMTKVGKRLIQINLKNVVK